MKRSEVVELMVSRYKSYTENVPDSSLESIMSYVLKGLEAVGLTSKVPSEYSCLQEFSDCDFWTEEDSANKAD